MAFRSSIILFILLILSSNSALAFCGFFVAKADTKLFNKASKVVMVRDDNKTVLTMASDYQGNLKEFAMVIPVPEVLKKGQIHVTNNKLIDHLDAYSSPRLVEYFDSDPCAVQMMMKRQAMLMETQRASGAQNSAKKLGVKIEAEYTVGEYDILILSAKESDGLITWLTQNDYKVPRKAKKVVESYLKQGMKFFVAKVNLEEQSKLGFSYLRPLQVAYESNKFMLPIRLGMVNAKDDQELYVFALTKKGRVETTNYRTVKIPSNKEIPVYVKDEFSDFYKAMYETSLKRESKGSVFLEYAWDMAWCDPCAADPLSRDQLRELGVFWLGKKGSNQPIQPLRNRRIMPPSPAVNVYITRLHLRYNKKTHPEDLQFQVTADRSNFQGRYILRHPWKGESSCEAAEQYKKNLVIQQDKRAQNLANLTGWDINKIRSKMSLKPVEPKVEKSWWESLWEDDE